MSYVYGAFFLERYSAHSPHCAGCFVEDFGGGVAVEDEADVFVFELFQGLRPLRRLTDLDVLSGLIRAACDKT
jgi:hypothetical protein